MHIPDGFLDGKTVALTGAVAAAAVGVAVWHLRTSMQTSRIPLLGVSAAFIFAAQMVNFPVAGGTSGHLVGSVLATVLLGPSAALIAMTAVLFVQCFAFADGGVTALGANILNMGLVGCIVGWMVYVPVSRAIGGLFGKIVAATLAAWLSTVLAATVCAAELAVSGTAPWSLAFPAMAGIHMLIGVGEAVITATVLASIARIRPELLEPDRQSPVVNFAPMLAYGMLIAVAIAVLGSPFASASPDGLDKAAADLKLVDKEGASRRLPAPMSDYKIPGIGWPTAATSIAGGIGTIAVFGLGWVMARALTTGEPKARFPAR